MLRRLPEVFGYLLHQDSLLALSVLAVLLSLAEWAATLPFSVAPAAFPLARLLWATYFFLVVRKASLGSRRLPLPSDHLDTWDTLLQPVAQGILATTPAWLAVLVFASTTIGIPDFLARYQARPLLFLGDQGWRGYLVLALWMVHLPAAVAGAICWRGMLRCLDPSLGLRTLRPVAVPYALTFALICGFGLVGHALDVIGVRMQGLLPIPLAAPVLGHLLRLWVPLAQARLLGEFLHRNRRWLACESA